MTTPRPNTLCGLTHTTDMVPIVSEVKTMKVAIGVPKGPAVYIYIHQGRWVIRYGAWTQSGEKRKLEMQIAKGSDGKNGFATRHEAEQWYYANEKNFAVSDRPQKIPFFTFVKRHVVEVNGKPEERFKAA